ncbi:hypothetical protein B0H13DRAFT_1934886 [Mycena leptocephala]|nr:hypothetical protein B0H13DRAFT_1934886 [Mycena leptocephala]
MPTDGTNNLTHTATDQLFIDRVSARWLIHFHTYMDTPSFLVSNSRFRFLAGGLAVRNSRFKFAIEPDSKAQSYSVMLALIVVGQLEQDEAHIQSQSRLSLNTFPSKASSTPPETAIHPSQRHGNFITRTGILQAKRDIHKFELPDSNLYTRWAHKAFD